MPRARPSHRSRRCFGDYIHVESRVSVLPQPRRRRTRTRGARRTGRDRSSADVCAPFCRRGGVHRVVRSRDVRRFDGNVYRRSSVAPVLWRLRGSFEDDAAPLRSALRLSLRRHMHRHFGVRWRVRRRLCCSSTRRNVQWRVQGALSNARGSGGSMRWAVHRHVLMSRYVYSAMHPVRRRLALRRSLQRPRTNRALRWTRRHRRLHCRRPMR